ncbi:putative het domain protein [Daldinia childiae]|uniref:putative het domain protein n=1 Tax=Daldinia childiae TaxID=326645 RepID=UPI0014456238|nr:putative het domain protein [Daldinia childiae]KAF3059947.1 putative het domain protein [Daldinia childiae]
MATNNINNPFATMLDPRDIKAKLAIIQPAVDWDAPIKLTLTEATLKDTSYECISYDRSGVTAVPTRKCAPPPPPADKMMTISIDGQDQDIPHHLESALRIFRRKERQRTVWADVLVSRTAEERSAQADVQRFILGNAERTLCWLGPDNGESTTKAFQTIHEMARRFSEACQQVGIGRDMRLSQATPRQMTEIRDRLFSCPYNDLDSFNFRHWDNIYDIFGSKYWCSVQSIADIVLAKAPIVICGRSNISWDAYIAATRAMPYFQVKFFQVPLLPHVLKGFQISNETEIAARKKRLGEAIELLPMVQTARGCDFKDPRENVFSMLHVATPSGRTRYHGAGAQPLPKIDRSKTAQQVFTEVARYSILERQDLMLWYSERPPCTKRLKGLPSWVPDFSAPPPQCRSDGFFKHNLGMRVWWEAVPRRFRKPIIVSAEDDALHLQVRPLDRIVHVSPVVFNGGNFRRLCFTEFNNLPPETSNNETLAQRTERFWRAILLNASDKIGATVRDIIPPPSSLGVHFDSLIAEESILKALDCTMVDLQTPENAVRIQSSPELMALVPRCGNAKPFEDLLLSNACGRRFFRTANGRFGMTAIEDVVAADNNLVGKEPQDAERGVRGDLGQLMNDPLQNLLMQGFQEYMNQRSPETAPILARAIRGDVPGQIPDQRTDSGTREGDIIVAAIGGFFPYVLRPKSQQAEETGEESGSGPAAQVDEEPSTYEFIGDCYFHGAMDGEDFNATGNFDTRHISIDLSKIVNITIV